MLEENHNTNRSLLFRFLFFCGALILLAAVFMYLFTKITPSHTNFDTHVVISALMLLILFVYTFFSKGTAFFSKECLTTGILSFAFTGILTMFLGNYPFIPAWFLGGFVVSFLMDLSVGLFFTWYFLLQMVYFYEVSFTGIFILFALGTALNIAICVFGKHFRFGLLNDTGSGNGTVAKNEADDTLTSENRTASGIAYLEAFAASLDERDPVLTYSYESGETSEVGKTIIEPENDKFAEKESKSEPEECIADETEDYSVYADEDNDLLVEIRETKKSLYIHSLRVAYFSENLAKLVGADHVLTKAVSHFHEVGKLVPGDVLENTKNYLNENGFPKSLTNAILECNARSTCIFTCRESAIVAISDAILTTYYFLKSQNIAISISKTVESALAKYMLNGKLDICGITVKDCNLIRDFYVEKLSEIEGTGK